MLKELFESWANVVCKVTGQKLFTMESHQKSQSILLEVKKGWISDPIGISVYHLEGVDKYGLNIYHCIRGTNSVEGSVHNPIQRSFASMNASPELADALIADFQHRHNVDCGSIHKYHMKYDGHYDPWLDHEISKLREDVLWSSKHTNQCTVIDTDPLDFAPTSEQFGITIIPPETKIHCNFQGPCIDPLQAKPPVYSTTLHLSRLSGSRKNIFTFLAHAQNTKYAVVPIYTKSESDMFFKEVSPGGAWLSKDKQPDFAQMAYWWSEKANGTTIFYKLPEHLALHFTVHKNHLFQTETMVASKEQWQQNEKCIRSTSYIAKVLPPFVIAPQATTSTDTSSTVIPDVQMADPDGMTLVDDMLMDIDDLGTSLRGPGGASAAASSSSVQLESQIMTQRLYASQQSTTKKQPKGKSSSILGTTSASGSSSDTFTILPSGHHKRQCGECIEAGRDGTNCPGSGNRSDDKHQGRRKNINSPIVLHVT